jgi:NitT/TauT family transport system ATP-binding protein
MSEQARPGPLISVRALSKSFSGPDGHPVPVLEGINLDVAEGEFVALLGRSGSGKSTLLRCIAGLMAPTSGEVLFRGRPLVGTNRDTTMVFQTFALLPWLTVQQNVEIGLEARKVPPGPRSERALRAIDLVGLDGYESAYPKELSGGMRQRVGFARALVVEPAALLMDEPFSALDVLTSENLRGELLELWEGQRFPTKTMVMVTHNIEEAVLLADRILVLGTNPGRIRADMPNPLPRPRRRRTPDFDALVDEIYRLMTHRDSAPAEPAAQTGGVRAGSVGDSPLPLATVDGLSGLAEILLGRHDGAADLPDLADNLGLEVDELLPLVDALVMLGFARLSDERLVLSREGRIFAGASIQDSKEIFARASLDRAPLVRTIYRALSNSLDGNLPSGFFTDILRTKYGEEEATRQLDVAVNWGRYAELYAYDATRGQIIREENGIGAMLAAPSEPIRRGTLHLYLGAAPGSGKTFSMLREGRALRDRGEDVVVGLARTRGRPRTAEAIGGLEVIPARPPSNAPDGGGAGGGADGGADGGGADGGADGGGADGGTPNGGGPDVRAELDLDAVLARKPAVVLVDDYGHNIAAIRSLRDAGIDVISTVDVADLERAAETVQQLTGQPAAATVSDAALAEADEIRFLDNSPEALRKRLGHGNIYPAGRAAHALEGPFRTENLAALREIGLRVVAETLGAPGAVRQRESQDVLVVVTKPDQAGALVPRGVRLARRSSAACTVLVLAAHSGGPPGEVTEHLKSVAADAGAVLIVRQGRDAVAVIAQTVRETGARSLVMAAPPPGLRDRWRPSLVERVADQLPDVHLHIAPGPAPGAGALSQAAANAASGAHGPNGPNGAHGADGADGADGAHGSDGVNGVNGPYGPVGAAHRRTRGAIRVYLGYAPGCGVTTAMLEEARRRRSRGADVVVATVDCRGREGVTALLEGLELVGDGATLDTGAVLARHPEVACVDDLAAVDPSGESRFAAARRLADAGITVVGTVQLSHLRTNLAPAGTAPAGTAPAAAVPASSTPDETAALALADEIELVDAPPSELADRVRRGEVVPATEVGRAQPTDYGPESLGALREQAFTIVADLADRQLTVHRHGASPGGGEAAPAILGCAAPRAGMEPLIRWSAALAARLAGDFRVAAVPPSPPPADLEQLLAGYAALTAQLGGQFAVLPGAPAAALTAYAREHHVTEMVLARGPGTAGGRHLLLRELARSAGDIEVHVLPAQTH